MTRDDAVILVQARMRSRRLPGKALASLAGRSILSHCLIRLTHARVAPVILATSTNAADDPLVDEAHLHGVETLRGPEDDVLQRFLLAASRFAPRFIVRATADNPAVDIDAPRRVIEIADRHRADHVCERNLPYGCAVEAVRASALWEAASRAHDPIDREHVTTYIRRHRERFHVLEPIAPAPVRRPDLRFTVDTAEDLSYMRDVFDAAGAARDLTPLADLIDAAEGLGGQRSGGGGALKEVA